MPWKEVDKMKAKIDFIEDVHRGGRSFAQVCREHGISRPTGYALLKRFRETGEIGELSRRPHSHPKTVEPEVIERVLRLRRRYPDLGPHKLLTLLRSEDPERRWPAASTVSKYLAREGLAKRRRRRRRRVPSSMPMELVEAKHANHVWAADFKGHFRLADGLHCHPLTISDTYSRYLLGCAGLGCESTLESQRVFERVFKRYGLPERIRTDNGVPFRTPAAPAGISRLVVWWLKLGIWPERTQPGHPEQNGRHERMHRTLKEVAITRQSRRSLRSQQRKFDWFRAYYNEVRPHSALEQKAPAELFQKGRAYRSPISPTYGDLDTRRIKRCGSARWCGKEVPISQVLAGETVALLPISPSRWRVMFCALPIGELEEGGGFTPYV